MGDYLRREYVKQELRDAAIRDIHAGHMDVSQIQVWKMPKQEPETIDGDPRILFRAVLAMLAVFAIALFCWWMSSGEPSSLINDSLLRQPREVSGGANAFLSPAFFLFPVRTATRAM